ncbi:MAG: flagellar hook-length control protein FliK [Eubacterium sp.]|nr:flagellar hook-length control protein FliK [Eubacterium sp.]
MSIMSSQVQNNGSGSGAVPQTARTRTYRTGNTTMSLREGQTLKGVVTDVHGNKITMDLGEGASFTGELEDASRYSIGQKAAFTITQLADNTIYMEAKGDAYLLGMDDTVDQALEEAALPKTDRNINIVQSLLENGKSIAKESIMNAIRLTSKFPENSVDAVITMDKLGMEMTKASVTQFQQYKEQSHQLLYKMDSLTDSINGMLTSIGEKVPRLAASVGDELLRLALNSTPTLEENELLAERTLPDEPTIPTFFDENGNPVSTGQLMEMQNDVPIFDSEGNKLTLEQAIHLLKEADPSLMDEAVKSETASDDVKNILTAEEEATISNEEEVTEKEEQAPTSAFGRMRDMFAGITDSAAGAIKNAMTSSGLASDFRTPFIHEQVGYTLSPEDRKEFAALIKDLPVSQELKDAVADGTALNRELLSELKDIFHKLSDESAGKLLSSKHFQGLVKSQFMSNWTLSPEEMKEEGSMSKVYEKMNEQFQALEHFSEETLGKNLFKDVSSTAKDMSQNLDFMKALNETFQYMQLPVKLSNQNAHGDLYVMTRKESLKKNPNKLKAVLHLEMDHLGTLDIHITKENTAVTAAFYVDKKETEALFSKNMEMLKDRINEQGFAFNASLNPKEKDVDIVKDFINAGETSIGSMQRYNFDLRA